MCLYCFPAEHGHTHYNCDTRGRDNKDVDTEASDDVGLRDDEKVWSGHKSETEEKGLRGDKSEVEGVRGDKSEEEGVQGDKSEVEGVRGDKSEEEGVQGDKSEVEGVRGDKSEEEGVQGDKSEEEGVQGDKSEGDGVQGDKSENEEVSRDDTCGGDNRQSSGMEVTEFGDDTQDYGNYRVDMGVHETFHSDQYATMGVGRDHSEENLRIHSRSKTMSPLGYHHKSPLPYPPYQPYGPPGSASSTGYLEYVLPPPPKRRRSEDDSVSDIASSVIFQTLVLW